MRLIEITDRPAELIRHLVTVWEASVRETHLFLSDADIARIKSYVPDALRSVAHLIVAEEGPGQPAAFMGIEEGRLEMLFLAPEHRGKGVGRALLTLGMERYGVDRLTVNEQNPQAVGFYQRMGFAVYQRTDHDEQGDPYPLLYMRLEKS